MAKKRATSMPMLPVMPDEFQRGPEAGPNVRMAPMREEDMNPTPEQEARMRRQVEGERMDREMERAAREAPGRSMRRGFAKGGSVGSASKRADGIAQRGKTKGRII